MKDRRGKAGKRALDYHPTSSEVEIALTLQKGPKMHRDMAIEGGHSPKAVSFFVKSWMTQQLIEPAVVTQPNGKFKNGYKLTDAGRAFLDFCMAWKTKNFKLLESSRKFFEKERKKGGG